MNQRILIIIFSCVLTTSCSSKVDDERDQFLRGCQAAGASEALCECSFDELTKGKSPEEVVALTSDPKYRQKANELLIQATITCRTKPQ
jgi:hypothetical protein